MSVQRTHDEEAGVVGLILLGVIVVGIAVAAFMFVARAQKDTPADAVNPTPTTGQEPGDSSALVSARNTQRKTDAVVLLSHTEEYMSNNSGAAPTAIDSTMLRGFMHYSGAGFVTGAQAPVATDLLRLVTGAQCADGGGTVSGTSRQIAAQYSLEQADGSFKPACVD